MVRTLVCELNSLGSSPGPGWVGGRGHCVEFLGKTLDSHCASLHLGFNAYWRI